MVLFEGGGLRVSPTSHLFVSDVNQQKKRSRGSSRHSCVTPGMERFSSDLMQAVKNVAGCGSVWNS